MIALAGQHPRFKKFAFSFLVCLFVSILKAHVNVFRSFYEFSFIEVNEFATLINVDDRFLG